MSKGIEVILRNNKQWAQDIRAKEADYFEILAKGQSPEYLWIGCADSRVPANELLGLRPGEVFVHRNVANLVVHADFNSLAVIHYAVEYLKVKHIIVCGHYGCGGVEAAMSGERFGLVDSWIRHVTDVMNLHGSELGHLSGKEKFDRVCELNAIEQAANVSHSPPVLDAWERGQELQIYAMVYDLNDGLLKPVGEPISSPQKFTIR